MKNLIIVYDDWCPYCIRFSKLIKKFDILRKISFFKLRKDSIDIENFDNNLAPNTNDEKKFFRVYLL